MKGRAGQERRRSGGVLKSTPLLIEAGGRKELVLNGHTGVIAYAPETGKDLWSCRCDQGRGEPTVTPADGLLYVANGLAGAGLYSIRLGGSGDATATPPPRS